MSSSLGHEDLSPGGIVGGVSEIEEQSVMRKVGVIGAGAFGTALAITAARGGHSVKILARSINVVESINQHHRNPKYLTEIELPENLTATNVIADVVSDCDMLILALPTQLIPTWLAENRDLIPPTLLLCNSAKGLYLKDGSLLSNAIESALGNRQQPYCVLSGPSFALEIAKGMPTAVVVASKYLYHAVTAQRLLSSLIFRVYTSQDVIGVELGGALKNPLAIGAGMIEGKGFGINTMAFYITRSQLELMSLCRAMGGNPETISGLSGVGDLILTCFGEQSRNRTCGVRLAKGEKLEDITKGVTVEGVPTAKVALKYIHACGLDLPIFHTVACILDGSLSLEEAQFHLMGRPVTHEHYRR